MDHRVAVVKSRFEPKIAWKQFLFDKTLVPDCYIPRLESKEMEFMLELISDILTVLQLLSHFLHLQISGR